MKHTSKKIQPATSTNVSSGRRAYKPRGSGSSASFRIASAADNVSAQSAACGKKPPVLLAIKRLATIRAVVGCACVIILVMCAVRCFQPAPSPGSPWSPSSVGAAERGGPALRGEISSGGEANWNHPRMGYARELPIDDDNAEKSDQFYDGALVESIEGLYVGEMHEEDQ
jgi:hypothetical protein